ncbi:hypothetical protein [Ralstonia pseudosolanacearum]|uniref:hypothetical protein n=1 Tax=Ralstonia pseudosolanacearum TaxID=1310165 RepID=UPI0026756B2B|nr:hypothetical protein [Ralstonia pseudosolanacearum]MDO3506414.1 hypothetical protein [Ralstonia pseudosolanacearum]MDO3510776.1 hypothetical protein [Ralstonia pseudosolanacearum]MDO3536744.1 hypothetical protein [Ralstonia pseudosolanacearum]MDO3561943.1 hypothetical protein [Ralstonia pseudosolanacearum]MDO3571745.1 hypothetical protein [Ralstonia pseudosolanacearum]
MPPPKITSPVIRPITVPSSGGGTSHGTATPTPSTERAGRARQSQFTDLPKRGHSASVSGLSLKRPVKLAFVERLARRGTDGKAETSNVTGPSADLPTPNPPASTAAPGHAKGVSLKRPVKLAFAERLAQRDSGGKSEPSNVKGPAADPPEPDQPKSAAGSRHAKGVSVKRPAKVAFAERLARRNGGGQDQMSGMKEMMRHQGEMMLMSSQIQNNLNWTQTEAKLREAGSKAAKELIQ